MEKTEKGEKDKPNEKREKAQKKEEEKAKNATEVDKVEVRPKIKESEFDGDFATTEPGRIPLGCRRRDVDRAGRSPDTTSGESRSRGEVVAVAASSLAARSNRQSLRRPSASIRADRRRYRAAPDSGRASSGAPPSSSTGPTPSRPHRGRAATHGGRDSCAGRCACCQHASAGRPHTAQRRAPPYPLHLSTPHDADQTTARYYACRPMYVIFINSWPTFSPYLYNTVWSELTCCNSLSHSRLACSRLSAHIQPSVNKTRTATDDSVNKL